MTALRLLLLLLLLAILAAAPGFAQTTVTLRSGAPAGVRLTNCTNATPIVCTADVAHGLANNDMVWISNVMGNLAANGKRFVQSLTSTTVSLYSSTGTGSPVAGTGAWSMPTNNGLPWMGKAADYTIATGYPAGFFDGPNGELTRAVRCSVGGGCLTSVSVSGTTATATIVSGWTASRGIQLAAGHKIAIWNATGDTDLNGTYTLTAATSTTVTFTVASVTAGTYNESGLTISRYAYSGNPAWDAIVSSTNTAPTTYEFRADGNGNYGMMGALRYFVDRSFTNGRTMARNSVLHPFEMVWGSPACDETGDYCGGRISGVDYGRFWSLYLAQTFSLLRATGDFSDGERDTLEDQIFADRTTESTSCTIIPINRGAPSVTCSGTTCTGTGLGGVAVGASMWMHPEFVEEGSVPVRLAKAVTSTTITIEPALTYTGQFSWARPWVPGDCGLNFLGNHHVSSMGTNPGLHPPKGGWLVDGGGPAYYHNLATTSLHGGVGTALTFAEDSARARVWLSKLWNFGYDGQIGYAMSSWTGHGQYGGTYDWFRSPWMMAEIVWNFRNRLSGYPDMAGSHWVRDTIIKDVYAMSDRPYNVDSTETFLPFGENSGRPNDAKLKHHAANVKLFPATADADYWKHLIFSRRNSGAGVSMGYGQGENLTVLFLGLDPNRPAVSSSSLPLQKVFNTSDYALCASMGMRWCDSDTHKYDFMVSRTGWNSNADTRFYAYGGTDENDHQGKEADHYVISKGSQGYQPCLIGGDDYDCTSKQQYPFPGNHIYISDIYQFRATGYPLGSPDGYRTSSLSRKNDTDASNRFAYTMEDGVGTWRSTANVSKKERHFLHLKRSGKEDIVLIYDNLVFSSPMIARQYTNFAQNAETDEGDSTCPSGACSSNFATDREVRTSTPGNPVGMTTKFIVPGGGATGAAWNTNDAQMTASPARVHRATTCTGSGSTCTTASSYEMIVMHKLFTSAPAAVSTTSHNPSANWAGLSTPDYTAMFARTSLQTSMPAVTTSTTTDVFAAGLAAGTYDVQRNGTPVCNDLTVSSNNNTLYCPDVASGSITILLDGAPPPALNLDTISLPAGTVGVSYTPQSLSASGGTSPYTFTCPGCSLPPGMTYSANVLSGTPTTAGTYNLTFRVDDAASGFDTQPISLVINSGGGAGSITPRVSRIRGSRVRIK